MLPRKFVLDTNCFVDASRNTEHAAAFAEFCALGRSRALSQHGGRGRAPRRSWKRQGAACTRPGHPVALCASSSLVNPSSAAWHRLGATLARLVDEEGLVLRNVRRSFVFDILIAASCCEIGATLVSRNTDDLSRIATVFSFEFVTLYPIDIRQ